jgi:hypothetical protein
MQNTDNLWRISKKSYEHNDFNNILVDLIMLPLEIKIHEHPTFQNAIFYGVFYVIIIFSKKYVKWKGYGNDLLIIF